MDVRLDILRRNQQAWLNSNNGHPSMVTQSAPVLTCDDSLADTFFVWYTVSKCASSPSRLLSCTRDTYRATSS